MNWLLLFLPVAVILHYVRPDMATAIFLTSAVAIVPLAGWLGQATEHLAEKTGEGMGGLLNATFGNAAELIIATVALNKGLHAIVKASLTGSIIGNVLLVMGASVLAGGLKYKQQTFNARGARAQATMLTLAAIGLIVPATFHHIAGKRGLQFEDDISTEISVVLLVLYGLSLLFSLRTHKDLFAEERPTTESQAEPQQQGWSMKKSILVLAAATALIAWISEILVGSVEQAAHAVGMSSIFVGVIVVAIVGNAAEHSTAVLVARKNRMGLSLGIALGSSLQVALFVAPVLVLLSYFVGPRPMDLVFSPAEVVAVTLSVFIAGQIAADGESNWMEGVQLLAVYLILAITFYFLPDTGAAH